MKDLFARTARGFTPTRLPLAPRAGSDVDDQFREPRADGEDVVTISGDHGGCLRVREQRDVDVDHVWAAALADPDADPFRGVGVEGNLGAPLGREAEQGDDPGLPARSAALHPRQHGIGHDHARGAGA